MAAASFKPGQDASRRRSGKRLSDPLLAKTYAGFAASKPVAHEQSAEPPPRGWEPPPGRVRIYERSELLRRSQSRRSTAPLGAGIALAATLVIAGAVGAALWHGRAAPEAAAPTPAPAAAREAPAPAAPSRSLAMGEAQPPALPPPVAQAAAEEPAPESTPSSRQAPRRAASRPPAPRALSGCGQSPHLDGSSGCVDARLAVLDQQVADAFAEAMRSGAAAGSLSRDQERWIIRRDRIRHEHPEMARELYRERIAQLRALSARGAQAPGRAWEAPQDDPG